MKAAPLILAALIPITGVALVAFTAWYQQYGKLLFFLHLWP